MVIGKTHIQLEDVNSLRKYPLSESSTCVDDSGTPFPANVITGLCLVSFISLDRPRISYVHVSDRLVSVVLADGKKTLATLTLNEYSAGKEYVLDACESGIVARITLGNTYDGQFGSYRFSTAEQSELCPFCVTEIPNSLVLGIVDDSSGTRHTGPVSIVFNGGIVSEVDANGSVVLSASDAIEKNLSGGCVPTDLNKSCVAPVIQSINGVRPNELGEIALVFE